MNNNFSDRVSQWFRRYANLHTVGVVSLVLLVIGIILAGIILLSTYQAESLGAKEFCLTSKCVENWIDKNKSALLVLGVMGNVLIGFVTIGGIVVALLSYQNSVRTSAVTNHLSHLNIFMSYVHGETSRRSRLSKSEVEALKWYNLIYSESVQGDFTVSPLYVDFVMRINRQVSDSNSKYLNSSTRPEDKYKYRDHQEQMIKLLSEIGLYLERLPRIDFNEVEGQVFDLLRAVNLSFCRVNSIPEIIVRTYH